MINLSYKFDQNSASLELSGIPDVSKGDSDKTIGIISSWSLEIIGSPALEGKKEHLEYLMQVILQYSRSYISGIRKPYTSSKNIVQISPLGKNHKLLLTSTREGIKPLEIILDDAELSDLTRCLDLLRFDTRFNVKWDMKIDRPFSRKYIFNNLNKSRTNLNFFYSFILFLFTSSFLFLIPINNNLEFKDNNISVPLGSEISK